ncbi:MAG: hypothetical protein FWC93_02900 [Defluviitaleaceae bacterium]|nr:hypothetical protein [Defluviitaleaceae bacterium]
MAAFEFGNYPEKPGRGTFGPGTSAASTGTPAFGAGHGHGHGHGNVEIPNPHHRLRSEPLLALKIYDSCRHKNCLTRSELGFARSIDGHPIIPPEDAHSVTIENLHIRRIVIAKKEPSPFKRGFWDVEVRYIFDYELKFAGHEDNKYENVHATSSFTRCTNLFGSVGAEVAMATDLFGRAETTMSGEPFAIVEAKALGLAAEIVRKRCHHHEEPAHVAVTIGLFSIIKLYRLVSLLVESRGFVIPEACGDVCPLNPCDFFEELNFPMDSFAPPQKPEFMAGVSGDIPSAVREEPKG